MKIIISFKHLLYINKNTLSKRFRQSKADEISFAYYLQNSTDALETMDLMLASINREIAQHSPAQSRLCLSTQQHLEERAAEAVKRSSADVLSELLADVESTNSIHTPESARSTRSTQMAHAKQLLSELESSSIMLYLHPGEHKQAAGNRPARTTAH